MMARVILYVGAVMLGLLLLLERPVPMAIESSDTTPSTSFARG